jgi:dienelactone hydrolase
MLKTALLFTDIFGLPKVDNQLLTDHWASVGYQAYAPDYFGGEPFPQDGSVRQGFSKQPR